MKQKYVRLVNNWAVDLSYDPWNEFHSSLAAEFIECPEYVMPGFFKDGDKWIDPRKPIEEEF